ncbi:MAG: hypothetical protein ACRDK0_10510 [Solirubrobacteraceae bacterium]
MGKIWVLDTETKGTGAQMVPLEKVLRKPAATKEPLFVPPKRQPKPQPPGPVPRAPRRFKVIDVATREVLAEGADARTTLDLLGGVRSSVDINVYVWEPADDKWRLLSLREQQLLWERRRR